MTEKKILERDAAAAQAYNIQRAQTKMAAKDLLL